jgi:hypothetical protein
VDVIGITVCGVGCDRMIVIGSETKNATLFFYF